jgi:LuxR family transcriptional regulator of csgAB operon
MPEIQEHNSQNENESNIVFSQREHEILDLLVCGKSNKEISLSLGITVHTVKKHLTSIYKKINVKCRTEAVVWWLGHGRDFRN